MSIYINQLIQQPNLPNTFISTAHLNRYPLTAKGVFGNSILGSVWYFD